MQLFINFNRYLSGDALVHLDKINLNICEFSLTYAQAHFLDTRGYS